jgi:hypothetical protein
MEGEYSRNLGNAQPPLCDKKFETINALIAVLSIGVNQNPRPNGTIHLRAEKEGGGLTISVSCPYLAPYK